jgi:threonine dehydrogenase-like Zn-dependent dehydrogenase
LDKQGYFHYIDRKRHFIRRRGVNISTFEVEGVLFNHPDVANCAVIGVPADIGEEEILAAVQPKDGTDVDPAALLRWCEGHLAPFMIPRYVRVMQLPLTPSERVEKQKLRDEGIAPGTYDAQAATAERRPSSKDTGSVVSALGMRTIGLPELIRVPDPGPPQVDEVRVRMEMVALSIAEVRAVRGDRFRHFGQTLNPQSPFTFGFAGVGRVVQSGSSSMQVGTRVVVSGLASCGSCAFCRRKLENHCVNLKFAGIDVDSPGLAREFVTLPVRRVFPVPEVLALEKCCVVSEVATALHVLRRGRLVAGESLGVVGAGRHGRQIIRVAKRLGARVIAVDPDPHALDLALRAGADEVFSPDAITGRAFPLVIHANSVETSLHTCLDISLPGARIVLLGTPAGLNVKIDEFMKRVVRSERELIGTDSKNPEEFVQAIQMMSTGDEDWDIRHPKRLMLKEAGAALIDAAENWPIADDLFVELTTGKAIA